MSSKMFMAFFLQSKEIKVFEENIPGFFSIYWTSMVPNRLKVQTAVSVQLQRSLHGHSLGIGAFSSETISNFLKKNKK